LTDYGVFVGIAEGVDGMVHKSDLSWTQRINNPADLYKKGDEVEAIILSINHAEKKVSLGIKQLYEDPWIRLPENYPVGTILEVRVKSIAEFGVFVEIERGVEGLVHVSEYPEDWGGDASSRVKDNDIVKAEIISMDADERRIALSFRRAFEREETAEALKFMERARGDKAGSGKAVGPSGSAGATLGDVLKSKLGDLAKD
jgi:small subunit ribosomal protein S1